MSRIFRSAARVGVGLIFIYAGVVKAMDPSAFAESIRHFRLVSGLLAELLAFYLPYLEIVTGAALVIHRATQAAAVILSALVCIFTLALASAWWRGLDVSCGCFGKTLAVTDLSWAMLRNAMLLSALIWICRSVQSARARRGK